jgi:hypothetical protein
MAGHKTAGSDRREGGGWRQEGTSEQHLYPGASLPKSPLLPLNERGKPDPRPPLCKGETEGILTDAFAKFLRSECRTLNVK